MSTSRSSLALHFRIVISCAVLFLVSRSFASGPVEKLIFSFPSSSTAGNLVADAAGNLYGTTSTGGGVAPFGQVFELTPPTEANGAWTETILHTFAGYPTDGAFPWGNMIFDQKGNLYGTTQAGGSGGDGYGNGTIFELSPPSTAGGEWTETVLWDFHTQTDGISPKGKLLMDAAGNLYGVAGGGGTHSDGVVFVLIPPKTSGAAWTERIVYNFGSIANDGSYPYSGLLRRDGVFYGTTPYGGSGGYGTVYKLTPKPGLWTETILYNFNASAGENPEAGVIADAAGNLYGATAFGGSSGNGTVYQLSPPSSTADPWQEITIHNFTGGGDGGNAPYTLFHDKLGDLYGTTIQGGKHLGTIFKLKPPPAAGGSWVPVFMYAFTGYSPSSGLIWVNGIFYGMLNDPFNGGAAVYSFVP